jgi:hypothetical protein
MLLYSLASVDPAEWLENNVQALTGNKMRVQGEFAGETDF